MHTATTEKLTKSFLDEYNSDDAVLKYSQETAGHGINYLLQHDYGRVYDQAIDTCRVTSGQPLRVLEFGCGAGMNLIGLVSRLRRRDLQLDHACGTDFSASLIGTATNEARGCLSDDLRHKVTFHIGRNERLCRDLAAALGRSEQQLGESFDLILGVNTFRYCHRLHSTSQCAADIFHLLRRGGVAVVIDMNNRFPLFRSHLRTRVESHEATYIPSLDEYARPLQEAGLEITTKDHFCWIPHSAGPRLTALCAALTPVLNATVRSRAMRSLVVARKAM